MQKHADIFFLLNFGSVKFVLPNYYCLDDEEKQPISSMTSIISSSQSQPTQIKQSMSKTASVIYAMTTSDISYFSSKVSITKTVNPSKSLHKTSIIINNQEERYAL